MEKSQQINVFFTAKRVLGYNEKLPKALFPEINAAIDIAKKFIFRRGGIPSLHLGLESSPKVNIMCKRFLTNNGTEHPPPKFV